MSLLLRACFRRLMVVSALCGLLVGGCLGRYTRGSSSSPTSPLPGIPMDPVGDAAVGRGGSEAQATVR